MGKVSPNESQSRSTRQKRILQKAKGKYLKPGALAQIRDSRAAGSKSCTDLGKKRVAVFDAKQIEGDNSEDQKSKNNDKSPMLLSPVRLHLASVHGPSEAFSPNTGNTPMTPRAEECDSESRLESLPIDLLVKILCRLHHDQLRAVFHISQKIRKAVVIARQFHFNYTTPDRTRQEMLKTMTPLPTDHWPFTSNGAGKGMSIRSPHTPQAPKHGPRPPSCLKFTEMKQVAAVLFQESSFSLVPSVIQKPICKNPVLLYEDDLCQAIVQNKRR